MSRGGFRGRGRGRGGGPGGFSIPGANAKEFHDAMSAPVKHGGMLYPPLSTQNTAYLPAPTAIEESIFQYSLEMDNILTNGLLEIGTPWRLATERKTVGIEIESYSDRFKPPTQVGVSKLDPEKLKMDRDLFPPSLWKEYFEGSKEVVKPKKKKRKLGGSDDEADKEIEEAENSSATSADSDFDFEDDDSIHQDYDANYFDNGEGDDDSGGDDDDGGIGADD